MDETSSADEEFQTRKWDLLYWVLHLNFADDIKHKIRNLPRDMSPVVVTVLFLLWVIRPLYLSAANELLTNKYFYSRNIKSHRWKVTH